MNANPFSTLFKYRNAQNFIQMIQCIGHKSIDSSDNAVVGYEAPRQYLADFYGPGNLNSEFNVDSALFYNYRFTDSGIAKDIWLCVTLTPDIVSDMSNVCPNMNEYLFVISKQSVDVADNTIKAIKDIRHLYDLILKTVFSDRFSINPAIGMMTMHMIVNYMYRAFDINLGDKENFYRTLLSGNQTKSYNQKVFDFAMEDFKYCNTIDREDLSITKILGSWERFCIKIDAKFGRLATSKDSWYYFNNKSEEEEPTINSSFDMPIYPLTLQDIVDLTDIAINSAGWSSNCIDYDADELSDIRNVVISIFTSGGEDPSIPEGTELDNILLLVTTGLAIAARNIDADENLFYDDKSCKMILQYLYCLSTLTPIDLVGALTAKLRASAIFEDLELIYYCGSIDVIFTDVGVVDPAPNQYEKMVIETLYRMTQYLDDQKDFISESSEDEDISVIDLLKFMVNKEYLKTADGDQIDAWDYGEKFMKWLFSRFWTDDVNATN